MELGIENKLPPKVVINLETTTIVQMIESQGVGKRENRQIGIHATEINSKTASFCSNYNIDTLF